MAPGPGARILCPPRNCWRIERAGRVAFLVDGEAYYAAFRAAAMKAQRSIFILGWDIDSRTELVRAPCDDDLPVGFGDFIGALMARRPGLQAHVLNWDFVMLYANEREVLGRLKFKWRGNGRLHFHLDSEHPLGSSHHQKVVVIDDAVAFVGGMDIAEYRWDTPAHAPDEPRRRSHSGMPYVPFHDVQMLVDGRAAAALGELARERWRRATGTLPKVSPGLAPSDPWPAALAPELTDVDVAIARTEPTYKRYPAVQEAKQLYLDSIAAARRSIYIENQYVTANAIRAALEKSLRAPQGPEVVIVSRGEGGGWLERGTMTLLRAQFLEVLQRADVHARLRVYYPDNAALGEERIKLHSKVMIVDDRLVRVGSSNLNNRSMGLDTECDLAIEADGPRTARAIARLRERLLGEHLGVEPQTVATTCRRQGGSLIATIDALNGNARSCKLLRPEFDPQREAVLQNVAMLDPEEPLDVEQIMGEFIPTESHKFAVRRLLALAGVALAVAALAAFWRWGPLQEWASVEALARLAGTAQELPLAPAWVLGGFLVASLVAIPITAVVIATAFIFGPGEGFVYGLAGSVLGAVATYGLGHLVGQRTLRRLVGGRINRLGRRFSRRGLLAVLAVRIIPVAPFTVVNLAAGASHIRLRDFFFGTVLGMLPGISAITLFSERLLAMARDPSPAVFATLAALVAVIAAGAVAIRFWLRRRDASADA